jgi:hypothetical protein
MKLFIQSTVLAFVMIAAGTTAWSQTCQTSDEIAAPVRTAIEAAAQKVFDQASQGDFAAIRQNIAPSAQSSAEGIVNGASENRPALAGANRQLRITFLLDTGATPNPDGRFYCGVFGATEAAANSAEFDIPGLPAGKYGVVIQDVTGNKGPYALTTIFQDAGGWKVAAFWVRPESAMGHDGLWFLERAREYKNKGQLHNAWFYYFQSWDLMAPVTFMDTKLLSKITQESNNVQPKDVPVGGNAVSYSANGKSYSITNMSVFRSEKSLDLNVTYSVPTTSDFNATMADARSLAVALAAQYPELKDGFSNLMVHAVDAKGGDVVGMIPLKQ